MSTDVAAPLLEALPDATGTTDSRTPRPVAPLGGKPVDAAAATLAWTQVPGAKSYRVALAADPSFTDDVVEINVGKTDSLTLFSALPASGAQYYWRVRAENGSWSPYGRFQAASDAVLDAYETQQARQTRQARLGTVTPVAVRPGEGAVANPDLLPLYQQPYVDDGSHGRILLAWVGVMALTFVIALTVAIVTLAQHHAAG